MKLVLGLAAKLKQYLDQKRFERRMDSWRAQGMHIGKDVLIPPDIWVDVGHCNLISIGDHCGFGAQCLILAHDAQMDEFLDAARMGKVLIHESCHFGARTLILPGVEIGPRTIVYANSVVSRSLPPDTVCAGNPATVVCSLNEYLERHRQRLGELPKFPYLGYVKNVSAQRSAELVQAALKSDVYVVGGRSAELAGQGDTTRT